MPASFSITNDSRGPYMNRHECMPSLVALRWVSWLPGAHIANASKKQKQTYTVHTRFYTQSIHKSHSTPFLRCDMINRLCAQQQLHTNPNRPLYASVCIKLYRVHTWVCGRCAPPTKSISAQPEQQHRRSVHCCSVAHTWEITIITYLK